MTAVLEASTNLPTRHPAEPLRVPANMRMLGAVVGVAAPTPAEFENLGRNLLVGDPEMDALVDWMFANGRKRGRDVFEQALARGIDSVEDAPEEFKQFFKRMETDPEWLDRDLLKRAAKVLRAGGSDGMYVARDVALQGGYLFAGFNQTLLRTGALQKGSNKRFAETTQWALDTTCEGGLEVGGIGYQSTLRVRMIHSFIRRHVSAMPDWDAEAWGLPVNQTDMAATIHGTFIVPMTAAMGLGQFVLPREHEAVAHLTRYVGWLIGVNDEFLPKNFRDGVRVLSHTLAALATPDETSRMLAMPMVDDPMSWNYERFAWIRRRVARSLHLSILKASLGPKAMRQLGLPSRVLPWYPVLRFPINAFRSACILLPGGLDRAAERGLREQHEFVRRLNADSTIGGSVEGLRH